MSSLVEKRQRKARERKHILSAIFVSLYLSSSHKRNQPEGCDSHVLPDSGFLQDSASLQPARSGAPGRQRGSQTVQGAGRQTPGRFTLPLSVFADLLKNEKWKYYGSVVSNCSRPRGL